jgi:hypothetical protein
MDAFNRQRMSDLFSSMVASIANWISSSNVNLLFAVQLKKTIVLFDRPMNILADPSAESKTPM